MFAINIGWCTDHTSILREKHEQYPIDSYLIYVVLYIRLDDLNDINFDITLSDIINIGEGLNKITYRLSAFPSAYSRKVSS